MSATKNGTADVSIVTAGKNLTPAEIEAVAVELEIASVMDVPRNAIMENPVFGTGLPENVNTTDEYIWRDFPFVPDAQGRAARAAFVMVSALARANDTGPQGFISFLTADGIVRDKRFRCVSRDNDTADTNKYTVVLNLYDVVADATGKPTYQVARTEIAAHQIRNIRRKVRNPYFDRGEQLGYGMPEGFDANEHYSR